MLHTIDILTSTIASSLRSWRGTSASKTVKQPEEPLILFDREGCSDCRFVREALTELNLDVMIAPCPIGGKNISNLKRDSGSEEVPLLVDNNTDKKIRGRDKIIDYLFAQYREASAPEQLKSSTLNNLASRTATLIRLNAGLKAKEAKLAEKPLTLYSFESSPFSRPVRELLCELELPYLLVNLGKQIKGDMGPAKLRSRLIDYKPLKNSKRDAFFKQHGNVQVPYLIDPNTGKELFESETILSYLKETYYLSDRR